VAGGAGDRSVLHSGECKAAKLKCDVPGLDGQGCCASCLCQLGLGNCMGVVMRVVAAGQGIQEWDGSYYDGSQ
jgi:hypothetical protein